jgi:transcription termination factor Rho
MPKADPNYNVASEIEAFNRAFGYKLRVEDPILQGRESPNPLYRDVFRGQIATINGVSMLVSLNAKTLKGILVPDDLIRRHDLREGDVISCYVEQGKNTMICVDVLTINDIVADAVERERFEESAVCYPFQRLHMYVSEGTAGLTAKYFEWLIPFGKGQRGCLFSAPKAGKTTIMQELATALQNERVTLLVLLVDQSPETVYAFKRLLPKERLVYTTYEDDPERQVFAAEFLLKRAKRLAECGKDVVLLVDSLSALARAYNDTDDSLGGRTLAGGLESKTVHFIKKYFGAARCLEKGGSITTLACVSCSTGNPFDDVLASELSAISNLDVWLDEQAAIKHSYPAIDMKKTLIKHSEVLLSSNELDVQRKLWEKIRVSDTVKINHALADSENVDMLLNTI